jgi:hypothetical protein
MVNSLPMASATSCLQSIDWMAGGAIDFISFNFIDGDGTTTTTASYGSYGGSWQTSLYLDTSEGEYITSAQQDTSISWAYGSYLGSALYFTTSLGRTITLTSNTAYGYSLTSVFSASSSGSAVVGLSFASSSKGKLIGIVEDSRCAYLTTSPTLSPPPTPSPTLVPTPAPTTTSSPSPVPTLVPTPVPTLLKSTSSRSTDGLSTGAVLGIGFGCAVVIFLVAYAYKQREKKRKANIRNYNNVTSSHWTTSGSTQQQTTPTIQPYVVEAHQNDVDIEMSSSSSSSSWSQEEPIVMATVVPTTFAIGRVVDTNDNASLPEATVVSISS